MVGTLIYLLVCRVKFNKDDETLTGLLRNLQAYSGLALKNQYTSLADIQYPWE